MSENPDYRTGGLPDPLVDDLLDAGIYPALLAEIAASGVPAVDLKALLAWCRADSPSRPGGLFVTRLRQHLHPPGVYYQVPCPKCGRTGGHAPECTARYISGEFAEFIEH